MRQYNHFVDSNPHQYSITSGHRISYSGKPIHVAPYLDDGSHGVRIPSSVRRCDHALSIEDFVRAVPLACYPCLLAGHCCRCSMRGVCSYIFKQASWQTLFDVTQLGGGPCNIYVYTQCPLWCCKVGAFHSVAAASMD